MGQLKKDRVVRVERDLRAVVDSSRSSEQLVRWRVRRWRKGVAESHVVVELGSGEQGSLVVGMLRDWRALICFGSRVEMVFS